MAAAGVSGAAVLLSRRSAFAEAANAEAVLRGFIVSDAHFGWTDARQPSVAVQIAAMSNITNRFPDLDVFLDTGDSHHNTAPDSAYGDWTDVIVRGCGPTPFYFTAGNHEVDGFNHPWDPEEKTARLGSTGCRPYYSFDVKGIHFLVLPELIRANYVSREARDWAALDLEINKNRTVIILSHNSLLGTTEPNEDRGYRVIANSQDVYDLMEKHGRVIAWMHGHNHDYKIVPKPNRLYVSNGRIGGFPPEIEGAPADFAKKPQLGGMYFEVHPDRFVVRAYSATEGKFFDEIPGCTHLTQQLSLATSLDAGDPGKFSHGCGNLLNGMRVPIYQYHASAAPRELYLSTGAGAVLNDNTDLSVYGIRTAGELMWPGFEARGIGVNDKPKAGVTDIYQTSVYRLDRPGLTLFARTSPQDVTVVKVSDKGRGERSYYSLAPGQKLLLEIEFGAICPGTILSSSVYFASSDQKDLGSTPRPTATLEKDNQVVQFAFEAPSKAFAGTIYENAGSDTALRFWIETTFSKITAPIHIKSIKVSVGDGGAKGKMVLKLNGVEYTDKRESTTGRPSPMDIPPAKVEREVAEVEMAAGQRGVFLIRETPQWQTRNAPLAMKDGDLVIGKLRNDFSAKKDVIIAPIGRTEEPFVARLGGLTKPVIKPYNVRTRKIEVTAAQIAGSGEIELTCKTPPVTIAGAEKLSFSNGQLLCQMTTPGKFVATF